MVKGKSFEFVFDSIKNRPVTNPIAIRKKRFGKLSLKIITPTKTPKNELIADIGTATATVVTFKDFV